MKRIACSLLFVSSIVLLVNACKHPANDVKPVIPPTANQPDTALCFERDVLPVFQANCAIRSCHSGEDANSRQEGFVLNSYQTITTKDFVAGNPGKTKIYKAITENDRDEKMPLGMDPLTPAEVDLIYRWIAMGAPNTGCTTDCDSSKFTFSGAVQPLLNFYCKGCHNSKTSSTGVILDNYNDVRTVATNGQLLGAIRQSPGFAAMPQGGNKLSDCQVRQVENWIASGALND